MRDFIVYIIRYLPFPSKWDIRFHGAIASAAALMGLAMAFTIGLFGFRSSLWLLLLIPVPILFIYSFYCCEKGENEEKVTEGDVKEKRRLELLEELKELEDTNETK